MLEAPLIFRGGQPIAPHEVEKVLNSHAWVAEAAVVGLPDQFWDEIVAAAVVLADPLPCAARELTEYCRVRLAAHKVPVRWLFTSAIPRTAAGTPCRATISAQLTVASGFGGSAWTAQVPVPSGGMTLGDPVAASRSQPAAHNLRVPQQTRRSWALEDLDYL